MSDNPIPNTDSSEDILVDHNDDGIQEFANPLPGWWRAIFWAAIIFCVSYTYWYHFADGNIINDAYDADVAVKMERESAGGPVAKGAVGLMALMDDPTHMARGKAKYSTICLACHSPDGGGVLGLGPNLTDDHFKNVKKIEDILTIMEDGIPGTAMLSQSAALTPGEMADVAAYVASLRGTTPANPKEPEGEVIPPWSAE